MAEAFKSLSYLGIFLALCIEFVPAEIVLPLAGYWVYQGDMLLIGVVAAGSLGGVAGPLTLYWLGRYGGGRFWSATANTSSLSLKRSKNRTGFLKSTGVCRIQRPVYTGHQNADFHSMRTR
ncbi:hypothetical protein RSC3_01456 [Bacillus paralicheniformis]|nr:hypothetical protein RSC3_01456 [Bacillus paralicheniformis]